jgi:hypothetical protein
MAEPKNEARPTADKSTRPLRRWFQYSLRTLFFVMTLAAMLAAWVAWERKKESRREQAVAALRASGMATVIYESEFQLGRDGKMTRDNPQPVGPKLLRAVLGEHYFDSIRYMYVFVTAEIDESTGAVSMEVRSTDDGLTDDKSTEVESKKREEMSAELLAAAGELTSVKELHVLTSYKAPLDAGRRLDFLKNYGSLEELELTGPGITDDAMPSLSQLQHLKDLTLGETSVTSSGLRSLERLPTLVDLCIADAPYGDPGFIEDAGFQSLSKIRSLRRLTVVCDRIGDGALAHLSNSNLTYLSITGTAVTSKGLVALPTMKQLESLGLSHTKVDDEGMVFVGQVTHLKELHLGRLPITDRGIEHLLRLKEVQFMSVGDTQVTPEGVAKLRKTWPNAKISDYKIP